jgi:enoyl-CoA hydratase/carnithine racemase
MTDTLLVARDGVRLTLTLNRPERLNALGRAEWEALGDAALAAAADPTLRVVVVTGAGRAFAAGGDIEEFQRVRRTPAEAKAYDARVVRATAALAACPHPVIAAINGDCVGGGLEIAASCDLRIAAAAARFGIPVGRLAMAAPPEAVEALVDLVGLDRALSLLLEARLIDAAEADRIGLVTRVVADRDFAAEIDDAAARIAAGGPLAARAHKRVARAWAERRVVPAETVDQAYACIASADFRAGIAAFLAKRRPVFEGQ